MMKNGVSRKDDIIAKTSLYESREKIYPREIRGIFQTYRNIFVVLILSLYYGLAWIPWDGHQALLFDLPARKFYVFSLVFWPQDFFLLSWLLIICALSLFFFTALFGRVWCGFTCPQTVWTELFVWIERWVEGGRQSQIRLDRSSMDRKKILIKTVKHSLWILVAFYTGFTFVGYFTPIKELYAHFINFNLGPWETFWVFFYGFATWGNAGFLREQVCIYMCPYARFQSAMFDKDTLLISYDNKRGEPRNRGKKRKGSDAGDCIDCSMCVQVCPTGIDIRDGLQYECISCGACIDACNHVMASINLPKNLIRYTSEHATQGKVAHILRPRIVVYSLILFAFVAGFVFTVWERAPMALDILRDRNSLYRIVNEDMVENVYNFKVMNKSDKPQRYSISASGIPGLHVVLNDNSNVTRLIPPGEIANVPVRIQVSYENIRRAAQTIVLNMQTIHSEDEQHIHKKVIIQETTRFFAPRK